MQNLIRYVLLYVSQTHAAIEIRIDWTINVADNEWMD